jgi:hypothetical protein
MKHYLNDIAHFAELTADKIVESYNYEKKCIRLCVRDIQDRWILRNYAEILSSADIIVKSGDGFIEIYP